MRIILGNAIVKRPEYERLVAERRNLNANLQFRPYNRKTSIIWIFSIYFRRICKDSRLILCRKVYIVRHGGTRAKIENWR